MNLHVGTDVLSVIEPVFLAGTWCAFAKGKGHRHFPAFGAYLACRVGIYAILTVLLHAARFSALDKHLIYQAYYYSYWIGYLVDAGIAFLAIQEVFQHLMSPLPGLGRYGLMAFRWVSLISVLIALAVAVYPLGQNRNVLMAATGGAMRCVAVLELCLLAFIVLSMHALRLSVRSRDFGVALGLAMIAAADLFGSAFAYRYPTLASVANYSSAIVATLAAAIWMAYFLWPEAQTAQLTAPEKSTPLERWNEIAGALDQPVAPVTLVSSSNGFFLQDVERAVDRVLEKNSVNAVQ